MAATGLRIVSTHQTQEWPSATKSGALLRLFADSSMSSVSDIVFEANGGQVQRFSSPGQFYGWENMIQLTGANQSIGANYGEPLTNLALNMSLIVPKHFPQSHLPAQCCSFGWPFWLSHAGEMAFFSFFSPEVPQRNFYTHDVGSSAKWSRVDDFTAVLAYEPVVPWRNARHTINIGGGGAAGAGAVVASFDLENNPDLAGQPVYFAFEASVLSPGTKLSLLIDPGDGKWQSSNSSKGLDCPHLLGFGCEGHTANATTGGFHMRSFQATLGTRGVAKFAVALSRGNATLSGLSIARFGAMWHSL